MKFAKYEITTTFPNGAVLPTFKGSMIRGALGHSLKKIICAVREKYCARCLLFQSCPYANIFEFQPTQGSEARQSSRPHPYVIQWTAGNTQVSENEEFTFSLLLFGEANQYLPHFVYAIEQMGATGFGRRNRGHRHPFDLTKVSCEGETIFSKEQRQLPKIFPVKELVIGSPSQDKAAFEVQIDFKTPLRAKDKGVYLRELDFLTLTRILIRRAKSLCLEFSAEPPNFDERQLLELSKQVETSESTLSWREQMRYSTRHQEEQFLGGMQGKVRFSGDLTAFLPLLEFGKHVHIGKATSFGLGMFDYTILNGDNSKCQPI